MRRADRLFRLLLELRRGRVTTARRLAEKLEVSERTIYRDVADLSGSGVPIEGEAGVGYRLRDFDLPPLMFEPDEIEALVLGARVVEGWGDRDLAHAATTALAKIEIALPKRLSPLIEETRLYAPVFGERPAEKLPLGVLRKAISSRHRVALHYRDEKGAETARTVRPLGLAFYPPVWLLIAWCELRVDFRSFRLDRCVAWTVLDERFEHEAGKRLEDFAARYRERRDEFS